MQSTVAFLRAVNVGGKRKFPAADIRRVVEELSFTDVATHAASGNLFFRAPQQSRTALEEKLEAAFLADRGFDVPTVTFSTDEFAAISDDARELADAESELERHYVYLLKHELTPAQADAVQERSNDKGRMVVRGRAAHALLYPGYQAGVVDPLGAAKLLPDATNRNASVIHLLTEKWASVGGPR